jgi:hypothetical protein
MGGFFDGVGIPPQNQTDHNQSDETLTIPTPNAGGNKEKTAP